MSRKVLPTTPKCSSTLYIVQEAKVLKFYATQKLLLQKNNSVSKRNPEKPC